HFGRIIAFDKIWLVATAIQQRLQLIVRNARKNCGVRNLVAVKVQYRQNSAISYGIQEFVGMPGCSKRPCFRLAVADCDGDNEVRIVECSAIAVRKGITKLTTFVN